MFLTINTDSPEAAISLQSGTKQVAGHTWHASRELSDSLLKEIENLVKRNQLEFAGLKGIMVFKGPGSFTGLRIGITVANSLSYALEIPIVGETGDAWIENGARRLDNNEDDKVVVPEYGAEAHITQPKK